MLVFRPANHSWLWHLHVDVCQYSALAKPAFSRAFAASCFRLWSRGTTALLLRHDQDVVHVTCFSAQPPIGQDVSRASCSVYFVVCVRSGGNARGILWCRLSGLCSGVPRWKHLHSRSWTGSSVSYHLLTTVLLLCWCLTVTAWLRPCTELACRPASYLTHRLACWSTACFAYFLCMLHAHLPAAALPLAPMRHHLMLYCRVKCCKVHQTACFEGLLCLLAWFLM